MTHVVGVDGGGTGTRAVVMDTVGRELGRVEGGPSRLTAGDPRTAAHTVLLAVEAAVAEAGVPLPLAAVWAGLAGAGTRSAREAAEAVLSRSRLADRVRVGTDAEAAFRDAFASGPGILLVAGTGSIAWARNGAGQVVRVGGWGERIGDEGSGYAIGLEALRAVMRAEDRRGRKTSLADAVLSHAGLGAVEDLVAWVETAGKRDVAALARIVDREAAHGDEIAEEILTRALEDLEAHVVAALERAAPWHEKPSLALWGGVLGEHGPLRGRFLATVAPRHPVSIIDARIDAARGAAKLALESVGRRVA